MLILEGSAVFDDYRDRAQLHQRLGNIGQAIADYSRMIEILIYEHDSVDERSLVDLLESRAKLYAEWGDLETAITEYNRLIELDPTIVKFYRRQAELYDQLISDSPIDIYYQARGELYRDLGEVEKAIDDFFQVLEISLDSNLRQQALKEIFRLDPVSISANGTVDAHFLNVRSKPGLDSLRVGSLRKGQSVQLMACSTDLNWLLIWQPDLPQETGWISARYIEASDAALESLYTVE